MQVNWGSSAQAYTFVQALRYTRRLDGISHHVKNFRPHCLVLTGSPHDRPNLMHLVSQITKNVSLMVYANVIKQPFGVLPTDEKDVEWIREHKIKAFRAVTTGEPLSVILFSNPTAPLAFLRPFTQAIFVAATRCNSMQFLSRRSCNQLRFHCDVSAICKCKHQYTLFLKQKLCAC